MMVSLAGRQATPHQGGGPHALRCEGYDEASTRQIATRAGVALGTLFFYATDKRGLLFLVVNDELEDVALGAAAARCSVPGEPVICIPAPLRIPSGASHVSPG
jgi:hypothetical protein